MDLHEGVRAVRAMSHERLPRARESFVLLFGLEERVALLVTSLTNDLANGFSVSSRSDDSALGMSSCPIALNRQPGEIKVRRSE